jgi:hypothetical protein
MSGAPQLDLNQTGLDDIPTGVHADTDAVAAKSSRSQGESPQFVTKESILNCLVGDKATPQIAETS